MSKRIPIITDQHFGSRADSPVVYANQERFYQEVFWPAIDAVGGDIDEMLVLGDVSDRRRFINYHTLSFAKRMFFDPAYERGIRLHWTLGNHDLPFKQSLQLSSHEAFREYDNVTVYRTATPVEFAGVPTLLMPWICDENRDSSQVALDGFTGAVIVGHLEFGGFEMYRGVTNTVGLSPDDFKHFKLVMSGHYHHRSSKGNIHYLGAPYEMIWSDCGEAHGFHWWSPETHDLEFVSNPHHLFYRFVYDDADQPAIYVKSLLDTMKFEDVEQKIVKVLVRQKTQPVWYETFVDAAVKLGAHDIQFVDDTAWTTADGQSDDTATTLDTLSMIHNYVESLPWANNELQQDVTALLTELYHEAADQAKTLARS